MLVDLSRVMGLCSIRPLTGQSTDENRMLLTNSPPLIMFDISGKSTEHSLVKCVHHLEHARDCKPKVGPTRAERGYNPYHHTSIFND